MRVFTKLIWLSAVAVLVTSILVAGHDWESQQEEIGDKGNSNIGHRILATSCSNKLEKCRASLTQMQEDCKTDEASNSFLAIFAVILKIIIDAMFAVFNTGQANCSADLEKCKTDLGNYACVPVTAPTISSPVAAPAQQPASQVTTFYAIGDIPYSSSEATILTQQMNDLKNDADFLIHVGDIRHDNNKACQAAEFSSVAAMLSLSPIPVFVLVGDNEYTGK
jgi:hypothetical protein